MAKKTQLPPVDAATSVLHAIDEEFREGTDRGVAILGGAYAEAQLEALLRAFLKDCEETRRLLDTSGALGSHSSRIALACGLGLITDHVRGDLLIVARIRNLFAHRFDVATFDSDQVRDLCTNLRQPQVLQDLAVATLKGPTADAAVQMVKDMCATPRGRFTTSVHALIANLFRRVAFLKPMTYEWYIHDPDSADGPKRQ